MDQVLIQLVMDDQGEVSLEYLADLVRRLPPRRSSSCWPTSRPSWTRTPKSCRPASRRASCRRGSAIRRTRLSKGRRGRLQNRAEGQRTWMIRRLKHWQS